MRIKISPKLDWQEIYAEGSEVETILGGSEKVDGKSILAARFKNPLLMTDPARFCCLDSVTRDLLFQLYASYPRITEYDGVECAWDPAKYRRVWCPSIDTLLFAKGLRKLLHKKISAIVDIGCGSGFLGKYALIKILAQKGLVSKLHFIDIDPGAIKCAMDNLADIKLPRQTFVSYSIGDRDHIKLDEKYDLLICNPPYVPRPRTVSTNPYEGLFLIRELCQKAEDFMRSDSILVTNISSLCAKKVKPWLDKRFHWRILVSKKVPLKVMPIVTGLTKQSKTWLKYLLKNTELEKSQRDYKYWHKINIIVCRLK